MVVTNNWQRKKQTNKKLRDKETAEVQKNLNGMVTGKCNDRIEVDTKREKTWSEILCSVINRGRSRTVATSKMDRFVIIITKRSILVVAAVLDPPLIETWIN